MTRREIVDDVLGLVWVLLLIGIGIIGVGMLAQLALRLFQWGWRLVGGQ